MRPEGRIVLAGVRDEPDQHAWVCWIAQTVSRIDDREGGFAATGGGSCGEETHRFFNCGGGVGELIEQEWILGDPSRSLRRVGTKDIVVFSAQPGKYARVNREEVKDVADGTAGGIVA